MSDQTVHLSDVHPALAAVQSAIDAVRTELPGWMPDLSLGVFDEEALFRIWEKLIDRLLFDQEIGVIRLIDQEDRELIDFILVDLFKATTPSESWRNGVSQSMAIATAKKHTNAQSSAAIATVLAVINGMQVHNKFGEAIHLSSAALERASMKALALRCADADRWPSKVELNVHTATTQKIADELQRIFQQQSYVLQESAHSSEYPSLWTLEGLLITKAPAMVLSQKRNRHTLWE